ncbi:MAG: hypothetical protein A2X80_11765 [Geobacteraceae bacterium GWB2_52_12]|nr:MAG: hypothetical protein A2X80_11765 [Geobacteraceae bacterium GWB2_52_12]
MIRFVNSILIATVVFMGVALHGVAVYAEDASIVRATQVDGTVTRNGVPLKEGDVIQRDDSINTKEKSSVVLTWSNGSILEIYPETTVVLRGVMFEGDRKLETTLLGLEKGRIFAKAQVPDNIFCHFEVKAGNIPVSSQGAEFAVNYVEADRKLTLWSLLGVVIADTGTNRARIEDGQYAALKAGGAQVTPLPIPDKTREALLKTSNRLGGSLLIEDVVVSSGGKFTAKIGGVKNRRGNSPYTVNFKALTSGGSGKIKTIRWDFGDGESTAAKETKHTFTQGVYVVVLTMEDDRGEKATAQVNISVEENCGC